MIVILYVSPHSPAIPIGYYGLGSLQNETKCGVNKGKPRRPASNTGSELSRYEIQGLQVFFKVAIKGQNVLEATKGSGLEREVKE